MPILHSLSNPVHLLHSLSQAVQCSTLVSNPVHVLHLFSNPVHGSTLVSRLVSLCLEDAGGAVSSTSGVTMAVHSFGGIGGVPLVLWGVHSLGDSSVCYLG